MIRKNQITTKQGIVIIICSVPDDERHTGIKIAKHLLNNKFAACVTILPNAISLYNWQDKLQQTNEIQLLIKTHVSLQQTIFEQIKTYHSYHIPELLSIAVTDIEHEYLLWILSSLVKLT
ncbi:divalent-cation tolerance protein CutA [Blochmannia endosymbiont of Camponotus (Colobopsis) obliquus]|uniref:divalent-cation tolerance protein CutA n=1 Tax=Blochmannia endosymbiont of Camponotus (Colobopsis) obliquus TaxID=1505597 RepID=UPI00061A800D|nr:divalent cation tolerance protein CutA [Blochmannia endosymbiont of Camponotus (Colobopsis) obliquus]AKC60249.1 divalent-cation tolerance protein CutA [Blochmannia endosymbiont of Camponotus (Colobopsis) obliquus]